MEFRKRQIPKYSICKKGCMAHSLELKWTEVIKQENELSLLMYMKELTQRKQRKILRSFSKKVHENIKMIK